MVLAFAIGYFLYKFKSETGKMTPVATGKVADNVFAIKDEFANMYLIRDSTGYVAIDAGKDLPVVEQALKQLQISPDSVVAVFLTHTDMDHVAAVPLFKNATIYLAAEEVKMLTGEKQKVPGYSNSLSRSDYSQLADGQNVSIGNTRLHGILTAGHTSGSMCFQVNDRYLFTGDILSLHDGKLGGSVKFFDMDHDMTMKSIAVITHLPGVEYIFTSHWGMSNDYANAVKDWK